MIPKPDLIPTAEADALSRAVLKAVRAFYDDPANTARFEEWQRERSQAGARPH